MKRISILLSFVFFVGAAPSAQATPFFKKVVASVGAPIPDTYSASNSQSLIGTGISGTKETCPYNGTATGAYLNIVSGDSTAAAPTTDNFYVPAGAGRCYTYPVSSRIFLRMESPTTSGTFWIDSE